MPEILIHGSETQDPQVRLGLRRDDGRVYLVAVDANGVIVSQGYLLEITKRGTIRRTHRVSESLGFQLDEDGKIQTV